MSEDIDPNINRGLRPRGPGRSTAPPTTSFAVITPAQAAAAAAGKNPLPSTSLPSTATPASPESAASEPAAPEPTASESAASESAAAEPAAQAPAPPVPAAPIVPPPLVEPPLASRFSAPIQRPTYTGRQASPEPTPVPAKPSVPSGPPPLVEPPIHERRPFTSELATQAMSVQEISDVQAAPRFAPPAWTRSVPIQPPSSTPAAADDSAAATSSASSAAAAAADDPDLATQAMTLEEVADAEALPTKKTATSDAEALFHAAKYREEAREWELTRPSPPLPELPPTAPPATDAAAARVASHPPLARGQKMLLWIAGGLVAVLVLVAVFLLAARMGQQSVTSMIEATATPEASATPVAAVGPVAPGVYAWSELLGGECLETFESAWAEEFTVVTCDTEHVAQMLTRAELSAGADAAYPGEETVASDVATLCAASTVLNYSAASAVSDIQLSASYPADSADWSTGNRTYFCFVNRSSGEPLPGDLSVAAAE